MNAPHSRFSLFAALGLLLFTTWYGYSKVGELSLVKADLTEADSILFFLEGESAEVMDEFQSAQKSFQEMVLSNEEKIALVLPEEESLTDLTRLFDDFALKNHYKSNPFFISQLTYGAVEDHLEGGYRELPITMALEISENNLFKFLQFVETSGSVEEGDRLIALEAIALQLRENEDVLRVQLSLSAFLK